MFDLREHKGLIRELVAKLNREDDDWRWSVKSIGKTTARIYWEYLDYCEQPKPYFEITVYTDEDSTLIWAMDANSDGEKLNVEIVESKDLPDLNTPLDKAIKMMIRSIACTANDCY